MKKLEELENFYERKIKDVKVLKLELYKQYMNYIQEIIHIIFSNKENVEALSSYDSEFIICINSPENNERSFKLKYDSENKTMNIVEFRAGYIKSDWGRTFVDYETGDDDIYNFFESKFKDFEEIICTHSAYITDDNNFVGNVLSKYNIVNVIKSGINSSLYERQFNRFREMGWTYEDFDTSDFAFKVDYDVYGKCDDLVKEFNEKIVKVVENIHS